MWNRLKALILKETLATVRDPRNRVALIAPPLLQLLAESEQIKAFHSGLRDQYRLALAERR